MRRVLIIAVALLAAAGPATALRGPQDVARLQAEYRDEMARARRLRADAAEAAAEVADLERRLAVLRRDVSAGDTEIEAQRARLKELGAREAALTAELSGARGRQSRLLSALQMMSRRPPPPLLVPASRAVDTVRAGILMKAMAPELEHRAAALAARQAEMGRIRRLAALSSEKLFTTESQQGDRRAEMEALTARKTALEAVLRAEAEAAARSAEALEQRIRALGGAVPATDEEPIRAATRLPGGRSRLTPPTDGSPVERFGGRSVGWRWRADNAAAAAPGPATVAYAGPLRGWGQVVILDLGPGWRAIVAGLEQVEVQAGARVAEGQPLGRSAADGELYFELRRDERPIDPEPWLQ
ncbi:MAG: peptidoglycan DD-metalloendopeptidase family protein [Pseudomonadota bacterium]